MLLSLLQCRAARVKAQFSELRSELVETMDHLLQRNDHIGLLVDRADELASQAQMFHREARNFRSRVWWRGFRAQLCLCTVMTVVLVVGCSIVFCGGITFRECRSK